MFSIFFFQFFGLQSKLIKENSHAFKIYVLPFNFFDFYIFYLINLILLEVPIIFLIIKKLINNAPLIAGLDALNLSKHLLFSLLCIDYSEGTLH